MQMDVDRVIINARALITLKRNVYRMKEGTRITLRKSAVPASSRASSHDVLALVKVQER